MSNLFNTKLQKLVHQSIVNVSKNGDYDDASVKVEFSDSTRFLADYWRIIKDNKQFRSSFDQNQKYGLSEPINAIKQFQEELQYKKIVRTVLDDETGDLIFEFEGNIKLQVINVTGYEVWELNLTDGTNIYSNFIYTATAKPRA